MDDLDRPWFVIAGGGTGGHLYPGLAVAEAIRADKPEFDVTVFGTTRPIDERLVGPRGFELVKQPVRAFPKMPWHWPGFLSAWHKSKTLVNNRFQARRPAMVLGLGGYAAGPPIMAARKLGIPTAIFHPDAVPGRANRMLGPKVDRVFVQWEETAEYFERARDVHCTGCPIRPTFNNDNRAASIEKLKLDPGKKTLLITGASQGARSINHAMIQLADDFKQMPNWQIIHLTGEADLAACREGYRKAGLDVRTIDFTENMPGCMAAADLIVSRAGASTLAEISVMRLASILMPYPYDRKKHQLANARVLVKANAAELVEDTGDPSQNAKRLRPVLKQLMHSDEHRRRLARAVTALGKTNAAETIAAELLDMASAADAI